MNYEKRFCEIRNFLREHVYLHELEMLNRFELEIVSPYFEWIKEINTLSNKQLIVYECHQDTTNIQNVDLIQFTSKINELQSIPKKNIEEFSLTDIYKRKLNRKKVHELQTLKTFSDTYIKTESFTDIGSGAGHLSQVLLCGNSKTSECIDSNSSFQKIGIDKINKWIPELKDRIKFTHKEVDFKNNEFDKHSTILGLHSCGPLSTYLIKSKPEYLLNFGCCYHKLIDEYNISKLAQVEPLRFTNHSLTLAAKSHGEYTTEEFEKKFKVKRFRYMAHFLCKETLNIPFKSLGNAKKTDYENSFSDYVRKYLPEAKHLSHKILNEFYNDNLKRIDMIIRAGSLRSQLGRLIELYLLLDRVLFLRENNIDANLFELFDKNISPRNIAIFSSGKI